MFAEKKALASRLSLSSKGQLQTVTNEGKEGIQKQEDQLRTNSAPVKAASWLLFKGGHSCMFLSSSTGTKVPTHVEDGNCRLSTSMWIPDWLEPKGWWLRFLECHPITSPPTNHRKVTYTAYLPLTFGYENSSLKTTREIRPFGHKPPVLLAWPCSKSFCAPNFSISVCLASWWVRHTNLGRTTI